tara:strand:+ start:1354 stop:2247 length:894 start_codon:yes stop_codon:yes gene_type:complete
MKKSLISIVVNCYNGEKFLKKTLNSILSQSYKNYEVIFIDNCSTDNSKKIFKLYKDKRFKYFKTKKKINLYKSRNLALKKCNGNFITFLDTDDWWEKNFLFSRKKFFNSSKKYGFAFSNCFHYYEKNKSYKNFLNQKLPSGKILNELLRSYFVKLSTIIIKKEIIKNYQFNPNYNIIGDYDLIIRISENYLGMAFQDFLVNIRIHKNNFTHNNRHMFYLEFKDWMKNQNFEKKKFKSNQFFLIKKLEYLRLISLLLNNKTFNLIFDIFKFPFGIDKMKLLAIFLIPKFLINFKLKFF